MKHKREIPVAQKFATINADHKNARTTHQLSDKACKKKVSFFGDRASRQAVRDEMIKDGLELMQIQTEMAEERQAREDEINSTVPFSQFRM
ncbi:hypothetical protein OQJ13_09195 [Legionella sp. PATHC035]|uniref:hypothetical protein n=1 Tax=Legionella sp. PATHC035 TaxID=2992040 RepID=UPI002242EA1D|nr:hypothetical protein [Legionella sp. PATHC035]MCW8409146.1 hypothetical protein [Legionella sp. PATHC035]